MKLIKLLFIFLPTYAFADMDKVCTIDIQQTAATKKEWQEVYKNDCFRNNILLIKGVPHDEQSLFIARLCRFDRNVVQTERDLTCILYSRNMRFDTRKKD